MITHDRKDDNNENTSCLSKLKSFKNSHPCLFYGIIASIILIIILIILLCVLLIKKENKEEPEPPISTSENIFPLADDSREEVIDIYNSIEDNDDGTLTQFCDYLSQNSLNLKNDQKVYLAYYWITNNIDPVNNGILFGNYEIDPEIFFPIKRTVSQGFSRLFKKLLLCMNYPESKIKIIEGYVKTVTPYEEEEFSIPNYAWNAVDINGQVCLIDTSWGSKADDEYYLCTPPRCFIREHFPVNEEDQFLKKPISMDKFKHLLENVLDICKYNVEIIEDRIIQNVCGKGKVIVNFLDDSDLSDNHYIVGGFVDHRFVTEDVEAPSIALNRTNKGFEINFSVNKQGYSAISFGMIDNSFGGIYFYCEEEPDEKFYYPIFLMDYYRSDLILITPITRNLIKGRSYNFEVKTNDFDELFVKIGGEVIPLIKNGNVFKEDNIYIHKDNINIITKDVGSLIQYSGVGDDVDYPSCENRFLLKVRLIQPKIGTLYKGQEYVFELKCETEERIIIHCGQISEVMEREGNIYKKTITIPPSTTATFLEIYYVKDIMINDLYEYKIE